MRVSSLVEVSKIRIKVYIDNEFAFVLYKGELRLYHIKEGQELEKRYYEEILHKILPKRAKLRCMNLLKNREYTEKQLRDKMRQGLYPEQVIEEAVTYVKSYHYLDDARYASQFIEYNISAKSKKRIEDDLMRKGIEKHIIRDTFAGLQEEGIESDEIPIIRKLLEKKHYDAARATNKEKMKIYGFLYRKGFSIENINKIIQTAEIDE